MRIIRVLVVVCGLAWICAPGAYAQITNEIRANVPFSFYVQNTKLPAGTYLLKMLDDNDLSVMQIESQDARLVVTFPVDDAVLPHSPSETELIFHRYGKNEYLSRIFEEDSPRGNQVVLIRSELDAAKSGTQPWKHSIPAENTRGNASER